MIQAKLRSSLFWYILLAAAFLAISFRAFESTYLLQQEKQGLAEQQAREHLETLLEVWESGVFARANSWFSEFEQEDDTLLLEQRLRRSNQWFDGYYLWSPRSFFHPLPYQAYEESFGEDSWILCKVGASPIAHSKKRKI